MKAIDSLKLRPDDRRRLYFGNAVNLLRLELPKKAKKTARKAKKKHQRGSASPR